MRRLTAVAIAAAAAVTLGRPVLAATADLKLTQIMANVASAAPGDRVVFKAYARNLGPGISNLFVTYLDAKHVDVRRELCVVPNSETGDFDPPSADTPSCEFSNVPEGDFVIVRVVTRIIGKDAEDAGLTFCTSNGAFEPDPNADNDCKTIRIPVED